MHCGSLHCEVADVVNYNIVVSEFKLQLHYSIHFQTNTFWKGMNLYFP